MKKRLTIVTAFISLLLIFVLTACGQKTIKITGDKIEKNYEANEITKLEIYNISLEGTVKEKTSKSQVKVIIKQGNEKSINLSCQEKLIDEISVDIDDEKLSIYGDSDCKYETIYDLYITITGYEFNNISISNSVYAKCETNTLDKNNLEIYVELSSTLEVNNINCKNINMIIRNSSMLLIDDLVSTEESSIKLENSSSININKANLNETTLDIENSSNINSKDISLSTLEATISNSCNVDFNGKADTIKILLNNSSNLTGYDFVCNNIELNVSNSSTMKITALVTLKGDVSGLSFVEYKGNVYSFDVILHDGSNIINYQSNNK